MPIYMSVKNSHIRDSGGNSPTIPVTSRPAQTEEDGPKAVSGESSAVVGRKKRKSKAQEDEPWLLLGGKNPMRKWGMGSEVTPEVRTRGKNSMRLNKPKEEQGGTRGVGACTTELGTELHKGMVSTKRAVGFAPTTL